MCTGKECTELLGHRGDLIEGSRADKPQCIEQLRACQRVRSESFRHRWREFILSRQALLRKRKDCCSSFG
jgi:hypothetical protein